jgi:DNA-binding MarR family transcriptional regulator
MNYTLRQLQVFRAIANHGSITKAARHLHLTQPAVSLQFKSFSEQFDFPLIEYQGKEARNHTPWKRSEDSCRAYPRSSECSKADE